MLFEAEYRVFVQKQIVNENHRDPHAQKRIRKVERREAPRAQPAEIEGEKIHHLAETQAVDEVADSAADDEDQPYFSQFP